MSSADIYEFDAQDRVLVITSSYAVEVGRVDPASAPGERQGSGTDPMTFPAHDEVTERLSSVA